MNDQMGSRSIREEEVVVVVVVVVGGGGLYTCLYAWLQPVACGLHSAYSLHIVACSQ